jgi:adenylate cyclase, class 2
MKHVEVEVKFPLLNADELVAKLDKIAEKKTEKQKDTYYVPSHRNFITQSPITEWLRVRESSKGVSLNYKDWQKKTEEENTTWCKEFETMVDDARALKEIFSKLGLSPIVVVDKARSMWTVKDVEIAVDEVVGLGSYIEFEAKGEFENVDEATKHLYEVLEGIDAKVGVQDFKGYPHLLLEKKGLL